uniref:ATP-grasp domain-containing protein n=1 Tax=Ascaris lumbricoides TaxID=6252 RepID=A0A0M3HYY8_ASCLU
MESFSSGMNFLKRRFSSQDMGDEGKPQLAQNPSNTKSGPPPPPPSSFSLAGLANKVSSTISAPASPAKNSQSMYSQVQGITRNLMYAASSGLSTQPHGPHKCILIIDDQQIDWTFQPDFVLFRQAAKSEKGDFTNIAIALLRAGVQTLNTVDNVITFLNKNWMYHHLQRIATTAGPSVFPLLEQTYYPQFDHFNVRSRFPVVVRVGHGTHGLGKIKVDDEQHLLELEGAIRSLGGGEVIVEPYIDTKYDVHIQKIGAEMKAFIRKGISNNWRSNVGSAMLEQIAVTNRYKQWLHMVSEAFEGIDVLALDILVAKDGREIIHDANDVVPFLGDSQEEDRKAIADLIQSHIISRCAQSMQPSLSKGGEQHMVNAPPAPPPRPTPAVSRSKTMEQSISSNNVNGHDAMQMKPPREHTQSGPPRALQQRQASIKDKDPVAATAVHQDDTMGQLKRTFAGIFGDV